jgi:hypothetical protein
MVRSRPRPIRAASTTSAETNSVNSLSATAAPADNPNLTAALNLAAAGLPVFPAGPDKRPLLAGWQEKATTEEEQIRKWWDGYSPALPAIVVGRAGLVVIDCDRHPGGNDGIKAFNQLVSANGAKLANVPMTRTARGGAHLFFRQPPGEQLGNGRGELPDGIDVRGVGGFVIAPGAESDGKRWQSANGRPSLADAFKTGTIPELPQWLADIIRQNRQPNGNGTDEYALNFAKRGANSSSRGQAYAAAALDGAAAELSATPNGERNETLNAVAFRMGKLIARDWVDEKTVTEALLGACDANKYLREHGHRATMKTIESGIEAGRKEPHPDLPDREPSSGDDRTPLSDLSSLSGSQGTKQQSNGDYAKRKTGTWDEPDWALLDDRRGDLPDFPTDIFAPPIRGWLQRAAHGAGVFPDHVAVPMLGVVASLIGTARRVRASRSWSEPVTLWTALVAASGDRKTPGLNVTRRALDLIEADQVAAIAAARLVHETRVQRAKEAAKKWKEDRQEAMKGTPPRDPPSMPREALDPGNFIEPRLYATDPTIEKLAALLRARPRGMMLLRDELAGLFANMGRYSGGSDRPFWLEAWVGSRHVVERVSGTIVVDHLLVGIIGSFQPDKLARAFQGDEDGMYGRFLFGWPSTPDYRPLTNEVAEIEPELQSALKALIRLPAEDADNAFKPQAIPLSPKAVEKFEDYRRHVDKMKRALDGVERQWLVKSESQVLRLAGALTYLTWAFTLGTSGTNGIAMITADLEPKEIGEESISAATRLMKEYFWPHARAALRQIGLTDRHRNARRALRWIAAGGKYEVSREDIRRDALGQSLDAEQVQELLETLVKWGWLKEESIATPGRSRRRWRVNPKLLVSSTAESAESARR